MAIVITVDGNESVGNMRQAHGTFTSAERDHTVTLPPSTTGINNAVAYDVTLDPGAIGTQKARITNSLGTITAVFQDTQGLSGRWQVTGN